jgi:hypothetical protein
LLEFSKHFGDVKFKLTIWTSLFLWTKLAY